MADLGIESSRTFVDRHKLRIILFSVLAVCIIGISIIYLSLGAITPYMGVALSETDKGWVVDDVFDTGLAHEAGIKTGDIPVEINGQPADTFLQAYTKNGAVFGMLIKQITVTDSSGQQKTANLEGSHPSWPIWFQIISWFVVCLVSWATGLFVYFKNPKNLAALLLGIGLLDLSLALTSNVGSERAIYLSSQLEVIAAVIGPWLLMHFFLVLPEERAGLRRTPWLYLIYIIPLVTLILFFLVGYKDGQPVSWFRSLRFMEYGVGFLGAAVVAIINYFHAASARTRQQMKIVLVGCLGALIPFLIFNIIPAAITGQTILPPRIVLLFIAFIPAALGYAVITQKLLDIDLVVRRSVVYGLVTAVMAIILSAAVVPVMVFGDSISMPAQIGIIIVLGAVATALFGPVKTGIETLIDKFFYKDRYDYRQTIQGLSTSLNSMKEFADISRMIVGTTVSTLNVAGGCLFVKGQSNDLEVRAAEGTFADLNKQLRLRMLFSQRSFQYEFPNSASSLDPELAFLIPLKAGENEIGLLCLSQKVSRQDFSSNDIFLLQGLVSVASVALRNAMLVRDVSIRDTFVSIASHELRTPLTSIMGYSELLQRPGLSEATRKEWLDIIITSGQRITDMVDDLLNVTRIQSGKVTLKLEPVKVADAIREPLSITRESTAAHEIVMFLEPNLPEVYVDRGKFGQIIGNLLGNAVKYSPKGGRVTLSAKKEPGKNRVVVSVADQGIGISPEDKEQLFKTFHRIQRPETWGVRGSGLGLYIVKEWTEAMGGEVWLDSELNRGSTFFVAVPAAKDKS